MGKVEELQRMIADAARLVAFTGAGISTESGIPDYRSPGGIWTKFRPIEFGDFLASAEARRETWRRKFASHEVIEKATPNAGHRALARLVEQGKMLAVITQNIDGLHQASGVPDDKVIELHGNSTYASCLDCRRRYELDWVQEIFAVDERLPLCTSCGGMIKTATISFGQAMPEVEMERAHEATAAADLFVVLGSSLVVYPAAGFPILAKRNGARLVIINREPTEQDELADLVINAEIGATMSRAVGVN
ncbi:MAG TPA: Sir2 family NAD-dependent protein deacetylase [Hyphomicrobiaceae bacterium]|jgi:NAD-dependent deacetylase|nr:Sir2 family NAD-dependent protein deacetylase [Hyphomicrobiaceae bacterium]